jgi:hypothetical protein
VLRGFTEDVALSTETGIDRSWPLEFDLQSLHQETPPAPIGDRVLLDPEVDLDSFEQAKERVRALLQNPPTHRDPLSPTRLLKSLEKILGQPKQNWNGALVRGLWPALEETFDTRATSINHEETWLSCAGYLLRPGYGAVLDDARIDSLWRLHDSGLAFPNKRIKIQAYVLWRRVAGGLDRARQAALLAPELARLREAKNLPADLVRLAGSLERLDIGLKRELAGLFLERGVALAREGGHGADDFAALASLLSRTPLYGGPETILPPEAVEEAFEAAHDLDWSTDNGRELTTLFLRAARKTGDRHLDIPKALASKIQSKLEKSGIAPPKLQPLREVVAVAQADRTLLYGESLPHGLSLG